MTYIRFMFLLIIATLLSACSSEEKTATAKLQVTEENKSYLEVYDESLQGFIGDMTDILKTFNNSLDGIYTKEISSEQFATIITSSIERSNKLVTKVEDVDVKPELFEAHQNLIVLINRSHQLLLNAVAMANEEEGEIDKEALRTEFMEIKTSQASIANEWKILRAELQKQAQETK